MIRFAKLEDLPQILEIEIFAFKKSDQHTKRDFAHLLNHGRGAFIVFSSYYHTQSVYGYCYFYRLNNSLRHWRILSLAVEKKYQRHDIGSQLIEYVHWRIEQMGGCISLEVRKDNKKAIAFYKKHGYKRYKIKHNYYKDGMDAIVMQKDLKCLSKTGQS
jgi:ribosomal protein S18 acetylase RimI-like enzyme